MPYLKNSSPMKPFLYSVDPANIDSLPGPLDTAVLFLIFNRPNTTQQVFRAIHKAKPPRLYIAADGPRKGHKNDIARCNKVREIATNIDWECEVRTLFRNNNQGCKLAVNSAIDWFFENESQGIILEDDCLPSQSFFWYCEDLLNKFKNDNRIFIISGYNKQNQWAVKGSSYFYSNFGGIWGWASWRRAWTHNELAMTDLDKYIMQDKFTHLLGKKVGAMRQREIENVKKYNINTWAYPWAYTRHKNGGLACVPTKSLIKNIGFGNDATHTISPSSEKVEQHEIGFPLLSNDFFIADAKYDQNFISKPSLLNRILKRIRS